MARRARAALRKVESYPPQQGKTRRSIISAFFICYGTHSLQPVTGQPFTTPKLLFSCCCRYLPLFHHLQLPFTEGLPFNRLDAPAPQCDSRPTFGRNYLLTVYLLSIAGPRKTTPIKLPHSAAESFLLLRIPSIRRHQFRSQNLDVKKVLYNCQRNYSRRVPGPCYLCR
ncbi:hypothetical protein BGW36DRAFT_190058 [Talaromyces proteolyticus]|uniref:Uncharacterized protein n=1 Tax=Talaromyces proteolyticus TaxID=1131652 RepID=A0AAD4KQ79_9EURO|nr:uncharacterized protein BGW36DRAFT_190058 [Talaromyces proteolyticus]KAH8696676.1 hypothetical protein BGW36DRAFT_190058 [Talaromyces proteolyticus]